MNAIFDKMEIRYITFETGDTDVLVNALIQQGALSYETQLVMGFSDLNILINKMQQKLNSDIDVSSLFETEKMYNGNLMYSLDVEKRIESTVQLEAMEFNHTIRQIRA